MNKKLISITFVCVLILTGFLYWLLNNPDAPDYNPAIRSGDFILGINNPYFSLKPGTNFIFEKKTDEGIEKIEVAVTNESKSVMGVPVVVVRDKVWLNNVLVEDTRDWYAQDKEDNVWYFGEEVDNYKNGVLADHSGSWEAGTDGAKPGIIMKADPAVGDSYRQEYYKGEAEDMAEVVALNEIVTISYGTFYDCLKTRDWSNIDKNANEFKYYCPALGFVAMEETIATGEKVELVNVVSN